MPRRVLLLLLSQSLHHVLEQHDGAKDQNINQFYGNIFHRCLPYFLGVAEGSSPLLAISSRMTVSACKFFMR